MSSVKDIQEEALRLWETTDTSDLIESYQYSVEDISNWVAALRESVVSAQKHGHWQAVIPLARHVKEDAEALVAWTAVLKHRGVSMP